MIPGQAQQFFEAAAAQAGASGYEIERSLRFNSADSAYLNRTPSVAGNRRTFTWSGWCKRSKPSNSTNQYLFATSNAAGNNYSSLFFGTSDNLQWQGNNGSGSLQFNLISSAVYRDVSAWYHIVLSVDSTQSTASDRIKLYVNGEQLDAFGTATYPSENYEFRTNSAEAHGISFCPNFTTYFDGYLADINFIDGQALAATDFGEYDDSNVWQPKEYDGTYGPSNTVDYAGNGQTDLPDGNVYLATQPVGNIFDGDESTYARINRGTNSQTVATFRWQPTGGFANVTKLEIKTDYTTGYSINGGSFQSHTGAGFTEIYNGSSFTLTQLDIRRTNASGSDYGIFVYGIKINDVLITSVGNTGFHLDFSDNSSNAALGTDSSGNDNDWTVNNISGPGGDVDYASMMTQQSNGGYYANAGPEKAFDGVLTTAPNTSASNNNGNITFTPSPSISFTTSVRAYWNNGNTSATYSYNGGSATSITANGWITLASGSGTFTSLNTDRDGDGQYFSAIEVDGTILLTSTGKDNDSLIDSPTNYTAASGNNGGNYCTFNPLRSNQSGYNEAPTNGNLDTNPRGDFSGTIAVTSGKWYWEISITTITTSGQAYIGALDAEQVQLSGSRGWSTSQIAAMRDTGALYGDGSTGSGVSYTEGDVLGFALDASTGELWIAKNNTWINSGDPAGGTGYAFNGLSYSAYTVIVSDSNTGNTYSLNAGQRPFAYTPPTNFLSLCTTNFANPTIADGSTEMDAALYDGDGNSTQTITGLSFAPDLTWQKIRNQAGDHALTDSVRGVSAGYLQSEDTDAEKGNADNGVSAFNSDGFTVIGSFNTSSNNWVTWSWDAGTSNQTISAGSVSDVIYDQSQIWSGQVSGSTYTNKPKTNAFNGTKTYTNTAAAANNSTLTFTPSGFSSATSVKIWVRKDNGTTADILLNGSSIASSITGLDASNNYFGAFEFTVSGFTSLEWGTDSSNAWFAIAAIEVDGKTLIDSNQAITLPTIASTVRANPSAGFSIVSYTGDGVNGSFAHGLNAAPHWLVVKRRDAAQNWAAYHQSITGMSAGYLHFNSSAAFATGYTAVWNSTDPTSSVVSIGTDAEVNANTGTYVAYCWAPIEGYSAFGSYTGNANADGPFVYTGFRPKWILIRCSSVVQNWVIIDAERNTYNVVNNGLYADLNNAEQTSNRADFTSNGFKIRTNSGELNNNNQTHIYAAFAEHPFKTARAR